MWHSGSHSFIRNETGNLTIEANGAGDDAIKIIPDGAVELYYDNSKEFQTVANGIELTSDTSASGTEQTIYLSPTTTTDRSRSCSISGLNTDGNNNQALVFKTSAADTPAERLRITHGGEVRVPDNGKFTAGASDDIQIYHDGSNSFLLNDTGNLYIQGDSSSTTEEILIRPKAGEQSARFIANGAVELYYDNSKKFETTSAGVTVETDFIVNGSGDTAMRWAIGGTNKWSIFNNSSGGANQLKIYDNNGSGTAAAFNTNGAVELYYDDAIKTKTTSTGIQVFGNYVCSDNHKLLLGNNEDLQIYHDGTNNQIMSANGPIHLYSGVAIELRKGYDGSYETMLKAVPDGAVELYYNNSKKFETLSAGGQLIGQWGIGTSTTANAKLFVNPNVDGSTQRGITISGRKDVYNVMAINFVHATTNSSAGSVTFSSTSAVAFNTSSDYRLKENVVTLTDSITKLKQLNPVHFKWKDQPSVETDGFLAHEVQSIVPSAITGEKDALNENGNIEPQQIDISKLTPLLTAALQEAITKIETLETKVAALESS